MHRVPPCPQHVCTFLINALLLLLAIPLAAALPLVCPYVAQQSLTFYSDIPQVVPGTALAGDNFQLQCWRYWVQPACASSSPKPTAVLRLTPLTSSGALDVNAAVIVANDTRVAGPASLEAQRVFLQNASRVTLTLAVPAATAACAVRVVFAVLFRLGTRGIPPSAPWAGPILTVWGLRPSLVVYPVTAASATVSLPVTLPSLRGITADFGATLAENGCELLPAGQAILSTSVNFVPPSGTQAGGTLSVTLVRPGRYDVCLRASFSAWVSLATLVVFSMRATYYTILNYPDGRPPGDASVFLQLYGVGLSFTGSETSGSPPSASDELAMCESFLGGCNDCSSFVMLNTIVNSSPTVVTMFVSAPVAGFDAASICYRPGGQPPSAPWFEVPWYGALSPSAVMGLSSVGVNISLSPEDAALLNEAFLPSSTPPAAPTAAALPSSPLACAVLPRGSAEALRTTLMAGYLTLVLNVSSPPSNINGVVAGVLCLRPADVTVGACNFITGADFSHDPLQRWPLTAMLKCNASVDCEAAGDICNDEARLLALEHLLVATDSDEASLRASLGAAGVVGAFRVAAPPLTGLSLSAADVGRRSGIAAGWAALAVASGIATAGIVYQVVAQCRGEGGGAPGSDGQQKQEGGNSGAHSAYRRTALEQTIEDAFGLPPAAALTPPRPGQEAFITPSRTPETSRLEDGAVVEFSPVVSSPEEARAAVRHVERDP